jgi:hypothetical protein
MAEKRIIGRIINKHGTEAYWLANHDFIPLLAETIVYDKDTNYPYERFKIGDGETDVSSLPFIDDPSKLNEINEILNTYILNIDYDALLSFDTSEIIFNSSNSTTSALGKAILGQMVLA